MTTHWEAFVQKFGDRVKDLELVVILEAFFYFSKNQIKDCEKILTKK